MSESAATSESAAARPEGRSAAGAALLAERRRQGLSLGDISRQLKLSVRQVEALERDDYSGYKGPVFIHGFIRNYAKLLGLDPNPLIRATDAMLNPPAAVPVIAPREPETSRAQTGKQGKRQYWPAAVTVLVLMVAMLFFFGGRRAPDAGHGATTVAVREKPASPAKAVAEAKTIAEPKARAEPKPEVEPPVKPVMKPEPKPEAKAEVKAETSERRVRAQTGGAIAAETGARVTVRMVFAQNSWVEIKDRSGNTIFGQLNLAGSRRSISGEPPLSVVVGNAAGVQLFQGDKSIDLAPHTRVDVARLTLE